MSNIVLISDTACDLPANLVDQHQIVLVPFYLSFNQQDYYKEIVELSIADFYQRMRQEKIFPKTSLPSIDDYYQVFEPLAKEGKEIICVTISGFFSGSFNSATNARELILENYPDTKIAIINSLNATGSQRLFVLEIARMIEDGLPFDQIITLSNTLRSLTKIFFYVDTLDYLENGGRIGKASALLGTMLNVKPIITLSEGELFPVAKVRGKKKAVAKIATLTQEHVGEKANDYHYCISHGDNLDDARVVDDAFEKTLGLPMDKNYNFVGATIGVNAGPDAVGICLIPKYETLL